MGAHAMSEEVFRGWVASGEHRRAAEWLVQRYADEVMGLCTAMVRDRSAAEDLVQDVFSRAFTGLKGFRAEASSRTWLLKIARNRSIDHLRARKREPWGGGDPDAELEPDALPDEEPLPAELLSRRADVEAALNELVEGDRALIVLRFRNGLDYEELAMAFGLKQGAVRTRVSRALARMRRALEERERAIPMALASAVAAPESAIADFELARKKTPPPPAAKRSRVAAPAAATARKRSIFGVALGAVFGRGPAAPAPPVEHPLTAFFAATREALSERLRERLLERARGS